MSMPIQQRACSRARIGFFVDHCRSNGVSRVKKLIFAIAALLVTLAPARADYAPPAFGMDRTTPSASPLCIMSGATCKVQLGTANLSTGAWTVPLANIPGLAVTLGVTRAQIPTTTIGSPYKIFALAGHSSVGDYGAGCVYTAGTSSGPNAIQDASGSWFQEIDTGAGVNAGCFGQTSGDSTTAVQAALNAFNHVIISHDTKLGVVNVAVGGKFVECTAGAGIFATSLTSDMFNFHNDAAHPIDGARVSGCRFFPDVAHGSQQTSGSYVVFQNCFNCYADHLKINQAYGGVFIYGTNTNHVVVEDVESIGPVNDAVTVAGGVEIKLSRINMYGGGGHCGINIQQVSGFYIDSVGVSNTGNGVCINPGAGQYVEFGFVSNSVLGDLDATAVGMPIVAVDGSRVSDINFVNNWTASSDTGLSTACTGSGIIKNITIKDHRASTNYKSAIDLGCGSYIDITGRFGNNSYTSPGTYPAIKVRTGVDHWSVKDSTFAPLGNSDYVQTQGWAVVVDAGTGSTYQITNNNLSNGYTVAGIADNRLGANRTVAGNTPNTWDSGQPEKVGAVSILPTFGATCNDATLTAAAASERTVVIPNGTTCTSNDLTLAPHSQWIVEKGGAINVASTKTLTFSISPRIEAGAYQIFTGPGTVRGVTNGYPDWFYGATDNAQMQAQADSELYAATTGRSGTVPAGPFRIRLACRFYTLHAPVHYAPQTYYPFDVDACGGSQGATRIIVAEDFPSGDAPIYLDAPTVSGDQIANIHMKGFQCVNSSGALASTCIRVAYGSGTFNPTQGQEQKDIYAENFTGGLAQFYSGRLFKFVHSGVFSSIAGSTCFSLTPRTGEFVGDIDLGDTNCAPCRQGIDTCGESSHVVITADGAGTGVAGIDFSRFVAYPSLRGVKYTVTNGAGVSDIFQGYSAQSDGQASTLHPGEVANGAIVYARVTGAGSVLNNISLNSQYMRSSSRDYVSAAIDIEADAAAAAGVGADSIHVNGAWLSNISTTAIRCKNCNGMTINGLTVDASGYTGYNLIDLLGTTKGVVIDGVNVHSCAAPFKAPYLIHADAGTDYITLGTINGEGCYATGRIDNSSTGTHNTIPISKSVTRPKNGGGTCSETYVDGVITASDC